MSSDTTTHLHLIRLRQEQAAIGRAIVEVLAIVVGEIHTQVLGPERKIRAILEAMPKP